MPSTHYLFPQKRRSDLAISVEDVIAEHFFGITLTDSQSKKMSSEVIEQNIRFAQEQIEGYLNIKLVKQIVNETLSYHLNDFKQWGFIPTTYPIQSAFELKGIIGVAQQVSYPTSWLSVKKSNAGAEHMQRQIHLVPVADSAAYNNNTFTGMMPHAGFYGSANLPNYWTVTYCTPGFGDKADIKQFVSKLAVLNIFHQLGDIILGAGIANQSIGVDGLSQSIGTTSSATNAGYGARVSGYITDLKKMLPTLHGKYGALNLSVA